uniref:Complement C4-like n=1 Tax=Callorhinchus milii TaxID=7868 RepID=A0A4W3HUN9_CALMI
MCVFSYMITGPNIMHVGVEESVSVQLHGAELPVTVTVYCWDIIRNTNCSDHVGFHLNAGNSFQEIRTIRVSGRQAARNLQLWRRHQHYVTLVAESDQLFRRRRMVHVRLSSKRGYIFIRTDKSIYTPEENGEWGGGFKIVRVTSLYERHNTFASSQNSKNMQITADIRKSGKILLHHIRIPDNAAPGNWRIEAQFSDSTMSKVSTQFEVKEFVLPRFEIKIKASEMFYLVSKDEFSFKILAIHTYGERVDGKAYVRFGILDQNGNKTNLGGLEQELRMKNGEVSCSLKTQDLLEQLKMLTSVNKLVGSRLYVALTVFETASGELEETEVSGIPFVATPYVIDLSKTRRHFAPGLPFPVVVLVTSPDQSPTPNIPVTVEGYTLYTDETGTVVFEVVAPANASVLSVNITAGEGTRGREFSQAVHIVHAYQSVSRSYLHMYVQPTLVRSGQVLTVQLEAVTEPELGDVDYIYYLVTNKGRVVRAGKTRRLEKTELTIPVDVSLVPTFRLIAYYYIGNDHRSEMVANSLWVDVKDECEGKIEVKEMDQRHAPGSDLNVILSTDDAADVAMVAVDSAVYIVNNKYKLTARKVFEAMNSYDLGCYYGGGANTVGVFMDAGLTFLSDVAKSEFRKGKKYPSVSRLKDLNQYTEPRLRKCCTDGLTKIPMRYSCGRRVERVRERRCRAVFLLCCQYGIELRRNQSLNVRSVARSLPLEFEEFFDETSIHVRSIFPHSWLWGNHRVQGPGNHTLSARIPDSITTWEIQAVAMFDNKGFCVAESKKLTVFQEFFISMRLPNAVTRNEQVDVRVILYNYLAQDIQVFVYMRGADGLCSPATSKDEARVITVRRNSAHSLGFPIVPLVAGNIPIHVVALSTSGQRDALLKHLRVGFPSCVFVSVRRSHDINTETPLNQVPDTESYLYIKARGDLMGESIENSLSPEGINRLIRVPTGCAEQTAMHLAPTVYAVEYLDQSQQWLHLPSERKDQALANIKTGYTKILEYQKADGSYGTWKETPSSVWLTAFMVKILSIARKHIIVNDMFIHKSVSYLINAQNSSGHFEDPHPVMAREMQGGVESLVSMTAFVTIALQHSLDSYKRHDIIPKNSIAKALGFLHKEVPSIKHPFVTAIAAYALTLASPDSPGSVKAHRKLKDLAYYNRGEFAER